MQFEGSRRNGRRDRRQRFRLPSLRVSESELEVFPKSEEERHTRTNREGRKQNVAAKMQKDRARCRGSLKLKYRDDHPDRQPHTENGAHSEPVERKQSWTDQSSPGLIAVPASHHHWMAMPFQNGAHFRQRQFPPLLCGLVFSRRLQIGSDFRRDVVHLIRWQQHLHRVDVLFEQFLIRPVWAKLAVCRRITSSRGSWLGRDTRSINMRLTKKRRR